jgi:hypothetical protein
MKPIEEEFPEESQLGVFRLAPTYTALRSRAVELERALTRLAELDLTGTDDSLVRYIILPIQQAARESLPPAPDTHQP